MKIRSFVATCLDSLQQRLRPACASRDQENQEPYLPPREDFDFDTDEGKTLMIEIDRMLREFEG